MTVTVDEAKAVLKQNGFIEDEQGRLIPALIWLTISQVLKTIDDPKPDRATIKRHAVTRSFEAKKESRRWKVFKPSFDEWLEAWQRREIERLCADDDMAIESLGFSYDPAVMTFPDPRRVDLILLDQEYENNEFVEAFISYHKNLPVVKRFSKIDKKVRQAVGRSKMKILWISEKEIHKTMDLAKFIVWTPRIRI